MLEVVFVAGIAATLASMAIPPIRTTVDRQRALGAVRYMTGRVQEARTQAILRSTSVAIRFERQGETFRYAIFLDGNEDGIRSQDVQRGIDRQISPTEDLTHHFPGVAFGAISRLPAPEAGAPAPGEDPVRFGAADMLVFTPIGTATPGSLYIRGRGDIQFAIRVFGETGKVRVLEFDRRTRQWRAL